MYKVGSAPWHGTPPGGVRWVWRLCRARRGPTNVWPPSRLCKAYARRRPPAEACGKACWAGPGASVGGDGIVACRARPSHGARATLPARWQHAHMWAPSEAGRRGRGGHHHGLGRVSPACAAGELCGATVLQHQLLTFQGTWDLDKPEDQVQQVLTEEE